MVRFSRTLTVLTFASGAWVVCFAGSAQAELIKLSDPWKGQEVIETDDFEIDELEEIRAAQQNVEVEKKIREALIDRAASEPLLLRGEADENIEPEVIQ